ncbi:MAG TPA: hypothetical protein VKA34_23080, partial [Balneolales bacterium]|nr:hypothetical protein [Balneolales bacterium]
QISLFTKKELKIRLYQLNLMLFKHSADLHNWKDSRHYLKKAARYEPDSLNVARNLMLTYIKEKNWSKTVSVGDSLLKHFPDSLDLIRLKAVGLYHEHKYSELLPIYNKLYEADPSDLSNALSYAELLAANGKSKESNKLYNHLLKEYPNKKEIYNSLLSINKQYHSSRGQIKVLRKMRKHFPDDPKVLDKLANIYARMDSSDTERQYYDTLLTMTHDTVKYRLKKIRSFLRDSNDSTAYQLANKLMKDYPDNRDILKTKGDLEINLKKWDNALSSYNRLKRIQDDAVVESELGKVFEALQKPDSALVHYHRAMNRETEDPFVPYRIAVLSFPNDRATSFDQSRYALSMAFKQLQKVQSRVEAQMHGNIQMSGVSSMSKQKKTLQHVDTVAKESFTFLTDHFPEKQIDPLLKNLLNSYRGSGRLYMMIAKYYMSHEKKETGLKLLKQSVHWAPQLTEAQKMLGSYYEHHGKINKAITVYQKMISLNPNDADSYDKLIDLYEQKHDLKDLCDHWLLQFRTHSDNKILQQHLIEALDKAGRYQEARKVSKMGN